MELKKLKNQIKLLKKAYATIEKAFEKKKFNDLEKDWVIQRFEYTIELSWKTCKMFLIYEKLDFLPAPREIIRESFKLWIIWDLELWEEFLDIRNSMSHMYSEYVSWESFDYIKENHGNISYLIKHLEKIVSKK